MVNNVSNQILSWMRLCSGSAIMEKSNVRHRIVYLPLKFSHLNSCHLRDEIRSIDSSAMMFCET